MFVFNGFWEIVLNPLFLITFGLAAAPFAFLLYSVWGTWEENGIKYSRRSRRSSADERGETS
jgi:hypothetical protein